MFENYLYYARFLAGNNEKPTKSEQLNEQKITSQNIEIFARKKEIEESLYENLSNLNGDLFENFNIFLLYLNNYLNVFKKIKQQETEKWLKIENHIKEKINIWLVEIQKLLENIGYILETNNKKGRLKFSLSNTVSTILFTFENLQVFLNKLKELKISDNDYLVKLDQTISDLKEYLFLVFGIEVLESADKIVARLQKTTERNPELLLVFVEIVYSVKEVVNFLKATNFSLKDLAVIDEALTKYKRILLEDLIDKHADDTVCAKEAIILLLGL